MARVVIRGETLAAYLRSPSGDVGRYLISLAEQVQTLAKAQVGYGKGEGGHLRDTIVKRIVQEPTGIAVYVGSEHPIALMHHEGTRPHTIVHHPGTKPNRYLTDPLEKVMASVRAGRAA